MEIEIIKAEEVTSDQSKFTHALADAIKEFVKKENIQLLEVKIIGENRTLVALVFYRIIEFK